MRNWSEKLAVLGGGLGLATGIIFSYPLVAAILELPFYMFGWRELWPWSSLRSAVVSLPLIIPAFWMLVVPALLFFLLGYWLGVKIDRKCSQRPNDEKSA
ncbi:MAG: hypothetical protein HY399_04115 [Elusimicrobia bacterium]|nr:hypothetical protein [Elusimicrobiota bacterium]